LIENSRLYLDSNIFIYAFESRAGRLHEAASRILRRIFDGQSRGCTSLITRAETLVRPLRLGQTTLADRYRTLFSDNRLLMLQTLKAPHMDLAAELRANYAALKLPDALHIATAIHADCSAFVTGDRRLAVVSARIPIITLNQL
jgi:predicted nucleic acid-binding protein